MLANMKIYTPEIVLGLTIFTIVIFSLFIKKEEREREFSLSLVLSILGILSSIVIVSLNMMNSKYLFNNFTIIDPLTNHIKITILITAFITIILSFKFGEFENEIPFIYPIFLSAILGLSILISANNMLMLFIGFQFIVISLLIFAFLYNLEKFSILQLFKYFTIINGVLLFGISLYYGLFQTLFINKIYNFNLLEKDKALFFITFLMILGSVFAISGYYPGTKGYKNLIKLLPNYWGVFFIISLPLTILSLISHLIYRYSLVNRIQYNNISKDIVQILSIVAVLSAVFALLELLRSKTLKEKIISISILQISTVLTLTFTDSYISISLLLTYLTYLIPLYFGLFIIIISIEERSKGGYVDKIVDNFKSCKFLLITFISLLSVLSISYIGLTIEISNILNDSKIFPPIGIKFITYFNISISILVTLYFIYFIVKIFIKGKKGENGLKMELTPSIFIILTIIIEILLLIFWSDFYNFISKSVIII